MPVSPSSPLPQSVAESAAPAITQPAAKTASRLSISWPHVVLSLIGMGISAYAWHLHGVIEAGGSSGCSISDTISCDLVIGSKYGKILGLPLGAYGMLFFAIVLVSAISTRSDAVAQRSAALQRLAITTVGICCSAAFTYISVRIIGAICLVCLATHTMTFALFCTSLWQVLRLRGQNQQAAPTSTV